MSGQPLGDEIKQPELKFFQLPLIVTHKNSLPALEIRASTTNMDFIKLLVSCAYHDRQAILAPVFRDKIRSLNTLLEKGIIYRHPESKQYHYTF